MDCSQGMLWLCAGTFSSREAAAPRLPSPSQAQGSEV